MIDFGLLYDKHIDNLFAFGSRFTTDRELIKDCIHDVFVKFYTKRELLADVANLESYLYTSLRNRINDEFRRNVHICDNEITDTTMRPIAEAEEYDKQHLEKVNLLTSNIKKGFDTLSPRQRQIINLYYLEHRKYEDICKIMGINYQSVRNLMHRSISRLREYAAQNQFIVHNS
ncbi:MAG: sigma-70 family RNA polymerase sigma factor [Prevotella sp.]|nr:sigma-70 family RNA polymerase sigma factor [Prevotella sp.]